MTEKNKAMTFEEWESLWPRVTTVEHIRGYFRSMLTAARIGYIPADRAIEVPDEWPHGVTEVRLYWYPQKEPNHEHFKSIPRPVPAWVPKVNDVVFAGHPETTVGIVECVDGSMRVSVKCIDGHIGLWAVENVKPFDPSKIGLPWSEI